jgi:hypothetical protein
MQYLNKQTVVYTFGFDTQDQVQEWAGAVSRTNVSGDGEARIQPAQLPDSAAKYGLGVSNDGVSVRGMRSVTWMAYALRAFVIRFWNLAKVCSLFNDMVHWLVG